MGKKEHLRVAIIGAGGMATKVHYPSLASFDDVTIAAACDLDQARLQSAAETFKIERTYSDYRRMIEEVQPDAVYAIGQPHYLFDVWTWCLANGQNLYIEKPMGLTMHQANILHYLAQENNCITQVSFQRRATPLVTQLREECLKRGPISHAICRFYKDELKPFISARDRMMDDAIHSIDTLRWMCGGEVVGIESISKSVGVPDLNFFSALLHFDNGATGILVNSWASGRRVFSVEMHAPHICVEAEHEVAGTVYADGDTQGVRYDSREVAGSDQLYVFGGFQAKHREFVDAVKAGAQPSSHFGDAIKSMQVAEKILAQHTLQS